MKNKCAKCGTKLIVFTTLHIIKLQQYTVNYSTYLCIYCAHDKKNQ